MTLVRGVAVAGLMSLARLGEAGSSTTQEAISRDAIAKGRVTYQRYCVSCHGREARGDGPLAKELRVPVPDLTTLAARAQGTYPRERVIRIVSRGNEVRGHGTADMPAWGPAFNRTDGIEAAVDEAIRNLAQYLESAQRPK